MKYIDFFDSISYATKKETFKFLGIGLIIGAVGKYSSNYEILVLKNITQMIHLLALIILYIFLNHIKNITNEKIYNAVSFLVLIRTLIYTISLSYNTQYDFIKNIFMYLDKFDSSNMQLINVTVIFYLVVKKLGNKNNDNERVYLPFIIMLLFLYLPLYLGFRHGRIFYYISYFQIIYFNIQVLIEIKKYNKSIEGKINIFKLNVLNVLIYSTSRLINLFFPIRAFVIELTLFTNVVYLTYIIFIILQIVKENYTFAFLETIEANKKLEKINLEIEDSNNRLEMAYEKINNRKNLYKDYLDDYGEPTIILNENFRIQYCNNRFIKLIKENDIKNIINRRIETYINFDFSIYENIVMKERFIVPIDLFEKKYEVEFINLIEEEVGVLLSFKDLTEELKIIEMKEELKNIKEREAIKNNFLSNISHDIKAPINVIYSEIQLEKILIENKDNQKLLEYNKISKENCVNLTKLTNNIIDLSKIDSENLEPNLKLGNIVEFIEDYLDNLANYIRSNGLDIIFDTEEEEIYIIFDGEMIKRILINLISNSIKYSRKNGKINVNILNEEDSIIIEFKDNGIGMSQEFLEKAFKKYSMERKEEGDSKGFGIGLYVVFNLVKAQNGDIELNSSLNNGSEFRIKFYK